MDFGMPYYYSYFSHFENACISTHILHTTDSTMSYFMTNINRRSTKNSLKTRQHFEIHNYESTKSYILFVKQPNYPFEVFKTQPESHLSQKWQYKMNS